MRNQQSPAMARDADAAVTIDVKPTRSEV